MKRMLIGILTAGFLIMGCEPTQEKDLMRLKDMMTGSFSSQAQSLADSAFFDIRLEMVPIWQDREDGFWLYVEQAVASHLDRPYRQRVYHVTSLEDGSFSSAVYAMETPLRFAGVWRNDAPLSELTPDSLAAREGCAVILRSSPDGTFSGSTVGKECVSRLGDARYATSKVTVTPDGITSWDQGFNSEDEQVWGAVRGGYVFDRK